ncbi:1-(5-phosphoribosyl)-5-amino-4-imidazole- carboxylate (AIR) carboxylase (plasmid) [Thalassoporum mexicanum PCC 7367]|uniref:nickel pincer cofactor biosynthesis protein LarB n=1 Tax=Thalassoporum mexicanum TaxID=3457544 RepID=UPI00029FF327|nr:nickel pincer cofactor biosynthesis protein LarB [Pseudanabaena sp. PCC 7367]AFY72161.1 1-(5-phosphoribosyl)-5-amino-4-imidazole- carboxylate (AIR) carboxylase [Pseudanabaena sp. PCC 7367]
MNPTEALQQLLAAVAAGETSVDAALARLKNFGFEAIDGVANIDHSRVIRNGFPEVIWGEGKTPDQIVQIMTAMQHKQRELGFALPIMATRISESVFHKLHLALPELTYFEMARICAIVPEQTASAPEKPGLISIITAGTADLPVAEEAAITAELCGFQVKRLWDVGVAGIHRLLNNLAVLTAADVLIVVAGMEGALPSVVGGLCDCPVIAVPTSVGYGASFGGVAALLTMLNSCAAGIGVVNIDNGFGAAILAGQILNTAQKLNN